MTARVARPSRPEIESLPATVREVQQRFARTFPGIVGVEVVPIYDPQWDPSTMVAEGFRWMYRSEDAPDVPHQQ